MNRYQDAWNNCDANRMELFCAQDLRVRWAYPGHQISDWGFHEACAGWRQAFELYEGRSPRWSFHLISMTQVSEKEAMAMYWVTFELDGKPTKEANLFIETFRRELTDWQLIRSYVESSIPRQYVHL